MPGHQKTKFILCVEVLQCPITLPTDVEVQLETEIWSQPWLGS